MCFFEQKLPAPESSVRAIIVDPSYEAFFPTRIVVQEAIFDSSIVNNENI
jgi:hypothetical protein